MNEREMSVKGVKDIIFVESGVVLSIFIGDFVWVGVGS